MKFNFYAVWLSVICIAVFLVQTIFPGFTDVFILNGKAFFEVWRFVSAIFLHGSAVHLLYNLFALIIFGSVLEGLIGGRKFLIVFFVTGIFANIISVNFYDSSLGASGAIYGVIGALVIIRPSLMVWAFGLPMPMFLAGILWAAGDFIGLFVPSNVGNIAHLVGMFAGLVFGAFFREWKHKENYREKIVLDERNIRGWEDRYLN